MNTHTTPESAENITDSCITLTPRLGCASMLAWLKEIQVFTGIFREIYIKLYRVALQGIWKQKVSYNKLDTTCSIV